VRKAESSKSAGAVSGEMISGAAPAIPPAPPRIWFAAQGMGLAEIGTVAIVVWRGELTYDKHERQLENYERAISRYPGRAGIMSILEANAPTPSEAMRRESANAFKQISTRISGMACVIEATGFVGSFQRSVLSGMSLLLPKGHGDVKFCADVRTGAEWLVPRTQGVTADALCKLVEELRARL
jgi:hypothetical protein